MANAVWECFGALHVLFGHSNGELDGTAIWQTRHVYGDPVSVDYGVRCILVELQSQQSYLMFVPIPLFAFGIGGLFTLMMSMTADICDLDELETGERREGLFERSTGGW